MSSEHTDIWGTGDVDDAVAPAPAFGGQTDDEPDEDLLAPVFHDDGGDDEDPTEDDGGISDADGIVRIWVEDSRLQKVRVSPNWYTKLERRRDTTLAEVFSVVLRMAHVAVAAPGSALPEVEEVELTPEFRRSLPELSDEALEAVAARQSATSRRFRDARQRVVAPGRGGAETIGRVKGITVRLDARGCARAVEFDGKWLDEAQAGQISSGVLRAAQDAYARHRPAPQDHSLEQETAREYQYMRKVVQAIMTPKERRQA